MMNPTMKRTLRIAGLVMLLVLMFCLSAQAADAASYKRADLTNTTEELRAEIGGTCFWTDNDYTGISESGSLILYSCPNNTATGDIVFDASTLGEGYRIRERIVTNGSKVYFTVGNWKKVIVYSCNADGSKLKKIKTLKPGEGEESVNYEVVSVYNGRLYLEKEGEHDPADDTLRSINLESGKISTHLKNCDVQWSSGSGRYIYYKKHNGGGPDDTTLRAYDCKSKKTSALTTTLGAGAIGTYDGKMYYYKKVDSKDGYGQDLKVYRCTLSGKEDKLVFTLPNGSYSFRSGSKIYCTASGEGLRVCYYNLKTTDLKDIYQEDLMKASNNRVKAGAN